MRRLCLVIALAAVLAGCGTTRTIVPPTVATHQASFDNNAANSGIISADANGFVVTPHYLERYDALLAKFGDRLLPPVKAGDRHGVAVEGENYRITGEVRTRFGVLNQMRKNEQGP